MEQYKGFSRGGGGGSRFSTQTIVQYKFDSKEVAIKQDVDKSRVDLLDADWLLGIGEVLKFGARKYSDNNWRGGFKYSRLIAAAFRHLLSIIKGEDIDAESGLPHVDHLACCVMFLSWHLKNKPELDDRWKP